MKTIEEAKRGSQKAFTAIYEQNKQTVYRNIYNIVKNKDMADDLTSEVFIKAFSKLDKYTKDISFGLWLRTIANNTAIDAIRAQGRENIALSIDDEEIKIKDIPDFETPESIMISKAEEEDVSKKIQSLDGRLSEVMRLRAKNLTYKEIAAEMGVAIGTIKSYMHKAKKTIKKPVKKQKNEINSKKIFSGNQILS